MSPEIELLLECLGVLIVIGVIIAIILRFVFRRSEPETKNLWEEFLREEKKTNKKNICLIILAIIFFPVTILYFLFKFLRWLFPRISPLIRSASSNGGFLKFSAVTLFVALFILMFKQSSNSSVGTKVALGKNITNEQWSIVKRERENGKSNVVPFVIANDSRLNYWESWAKKNGYGELYHRVNSQWGKFIRERCKYYNFPSWEEVVARICVESANNPDKISSAGAVSLMGIMPKTAAIYKIYSLKDLKDPYTNIDIGIHYLSDLAKKNLSKENLWLSYEHGPTGAKKVKDSEKRLESYGKVLGVLAASKKTRG